MITTELEGVKESAQKFQQLDKKIRRKVTRKAVNASIRPAVKAMRATAPKQTGLFRRSLTHKVKAYKKGGVMVAIAGQRKAGSTKAFDRAALKARSDPRRGGLSGQGKVVPIWLVENRIKPHPIKARAADDMRGGILVFKRYGRLIRTKQVNHPGRAGLRFMSRAAIATRSQSLRDFAKKFSTEIDASIAATPAGGK